MKILSVVKNTGLCLAIGFAGQANASLFGSFSGNLGSITPWDNTTSGDLAADIAADNTAPFNLGTLFTGSFFLDQTALDQNPSPTVGSFQNGLLSFSIAGGDIDKTVSTGRVRVSDNEVHGSKIQDTFQVFATDINESFVINGNTWILDMARIELVARDTNPSPIFTSDGLQQNFSESTPWSWEQLYLKFTQQGLPNSDHFGRFGSGQPDSNLSVSLFNSTQSAAVAVPSPATLPLLIVALGLLGLRRRN